MSEINAIMKAKTIPTDLLKKDTWYIGLYGGADSWINVKFWDGKRFNNTQNPNSECDVMFEPKYKMKPEFSVKR